ncbi:MAG: hypothetical protein ACOCWF_05350, partial [Halochromatium sp.]
REGHEIEDDDQPGQSEQSQNSQARTGAHAQVDARTDANGTDAPEVADGADISEHQQRAQPGASGDDEEQTAAHPDDQDLADAPTGGDEPGAEQPPSTGGGEARGERDAGKEPDAAAPASGSIDGSATGPPAGDSAEPDLGAADQASEAIDRFDQQGALPWQALDPEPGLSERPSLDGEAALGADLAVMEQRLRQVEGDPTRLMRNQFRLEEARRLRESGGRLQEVRPW